MKKILALLLALCICLSLCACGGGSTYGIKTLQTLVEQEYSLAFRNDDPQYYYIYAALGYLNTSGTVSELTRKWFGDDIINLPKDGEMLAALGMPAPKTFIIGIDQNSFPMAYASSGTFWGYDIELAYTVCELLGWTLQIQPIEKENVYTELYSGNIDCAWGGIVLDAKGIANHSYTEIGPYVKNDIVIAARESSSIWNKLKLSGKHLSMPTTSEATDALNTDAGLVKRLGQISRLAGGTTECFTYLYSGKCDVVLTDSTAIYYYNCH